MIKRRFYKVEHGDKDRTSSSSSESDSASDSSSDEEAEGVAEEEAVNRPRNADDESEGEDEAEEQEKEIEQRSTSSESGYMSENSSENEVEGDSSGLVANDVDVSECVGKKSRDNQPDAGAKAKESGKAKSGNTSVDVNDASQADFVNYILKHKSVFKCRLCPRIICLSEDTVTAHLQSKRHARSKKLLGEGRLKLMLNSDGEIEEEQETHAERHARTLALAKEVKAPKKKDSGRQRQSRRRKKRYHNLLKKAKAEKSLEKPEKKRHKTEA